MGGDSDRNGNLHRRGNFKAMVRMLQELNRDQARDEAAAVEQRRKIAELCRFLDPGAKSKPLQADIPLATRANHEDPLSDVHLSRRARQTLERLLAGDSEKQVARHLGVSQNTVHTYVTAVYRTFGVCSRGELLARFIHLRSAVSEEQGSRPEP